MIVLDSSSKMIDGLLVGSLSSFGVYDECVDTVVTSNRGSSKGKVLFTGQYCAIDLTPPVPPKKDFYKLDEILPELRPLAKGDTVISEATKYAHLFYFLRIKLGICVPSGCSLEDINEAAKYVGKAITIDAKAIRCEVRETFKFDTLTTSILSAFGFLGFMMIIGSSIDLYAYFKGKVYTRTAIRVLLAFSFISNFKKFVNTKSSSDTLKCLNGIRFLSMIWVVLGHTYYLINFQTILGLERARDFVHNFAFQAVVNGSLAVDTFFCMGGLLVSYLAIKLARKGHPFNITMYIIHRLFRLYPAYIFTILFLMLQNQFGAGPLWHDTYYKYVEDCYDNWWINLLFINNFYRARDMCLPQTWYLAVDLQLYIVVILIIIPMIKRPKLGVTLCFLTILISLLFSGIQTYVKELPPAMLVAHPDPLQRDDFTAKLYYQPLVHAGPYCIGMLVGYLLVTRPNLKISRERQIIGWIISFTFCFSSLYGVYEWNRGVEPSLAETILYATFNRSAWTVGIAWMILCCATGHGGVINYILSWDCFIPLGRLTFVVYLIHPLVQILVIGNMHTHIQPSHFVAVWLFFGHTIATYGAAFVGTMLLESPVLTLEKIMFGKAEKVDDNNANKSNSNLNGTLKVEKNGDIASMVMNDNEKSSNTISSIA
ncbi:hypothetical protein CDAR_70012 [Caerostris darwini]|uniref:Nose resistant-to-fluoxetine protein N-terminal domain-containing protein n=1 Tax=Caerostris darwini TaxID=1538125 RepID=A0AAV4TNY1_9ARAC|nr:hypothetical protein CDAR_70012 [Caerostris darwini]